ncbi:MAG: Lrp/AsnC family transcriptional regulator [Chloroflexi bacterium]|jgi:siroheme decarboxylase|nr:Lrp/AsnC family transcriptional regulator [Chloroflexota bacterium]MBT4074154.1 Lrp/AsnC family transcriptional regulator [Chloroflexota bacterium]MBT4513595.1 Lrp/AsnC family transcriptional regulator [Chloroflexota bacterium]MBT5318462.1 Lrp/AsnC family transcriptional regulator [Chloroflexota bacterium]MBT6680691.1 Lrp/AsnC family transcriptional regulator [Chloroflexota bacterium]
MTTRTMETVDREICNVIQSDFPLVDRPFLKIAEGLGITEDEVMERIIELKRRNVVRQIGAIFDTRRLGYKTTLVAMRIPEDNLDAAAQIVNKHPGVSHNYARNGRFNLWFTLAVSPFEDLDETLEKMAKDTDAEATRKMPTIRFFKIGVNFDMVKQESDATNYFKPDEPVEAKKDAPKVDEDWNTAQALTDFDIAFVRELQEDLPITAEPFKDICGELGLDMAGLVAHADDMVGRKLMRRFSAVLHHRRAGFAANAMGVWNVPEERSEEVGNIMAQSRSVTHCYERPRFPDWKYSHFTMLHATSQEGCEELAKEISDATGITDYQLLYSSREYKKTRVRYFVDE